MANFFKILKNKIYKYFVDDFDEDLNKDLNKDLGKGWDKGLTEVERKKKINELKEKKAGWRCLCSLYHENKLKMQSFQNIENNMLFKKVYYDENGNKISEVIKDKKSLVREETRGRFPNYDKYNSFHTTYKCPNCDCTIHLDWHEIRNYCPVCGKKLDWTEVSDAIDKLDKSK